MHVPHLFRKGGQVKQQGGGDVVGQIAHHLELGPQSAEVEGQGIPLVDGEPILGIALLQPGDQIPVDFHHMEMVQPGQQGLGEGPQPGPDFHHRFPRMGIHGPDNVPDDLGVLKEILTETFTGDVGFHGGPGKRKGALF